MEAYKKWTAIPKESRKKIMSNVYCVNCSDAVTITNFTVKNDAYGILLKGECRTCGGRVARLVEMV
ncbi:hypothetical protein C6I21_05190 [Alkalicoccus urumqiensis]|uniref:DUF5679 domain-containing protein n=1 Tax=Alkalicoccus urumqiensis TaxID=1548213 RepID=A0A2P6MIV7_ALKUR|nr:hypothetical protein C6I21_05190 [Alkalicoccus urumqiensis]